MFRSLAILLFIASVAKADDSAELLQKIVKLKDTNRSPEQLRMLFSTEDIDSLMKIFEGLDSQEVDKEAKNCQHFFNILDRKSDCCQLTNFLDLQECNTTRKEGEPKENPCDPFECSLEEKKLLFANKTINRKAISELLDKYDVSHPKERAVTSRVRNMCLDGKLEFYGDQSSCDSKKFITCTYIQYTLECPKWNDGKECTMQKNLAEDCKKFLEVFNRFTK